jgi:hypothetical protein
MEISKTPLSESSVEQKEKEQLPILFVYRDNDLFREYIPEIIKNLQTWGRKVEAQVFPQGMETEKIKEWLESNQDILEGKDLVSDWTVANNITYELKRRLAEKGTGFKRELDTTFDFATKATILGEDVSEILSNFQRRKDELEMIRREQESHEQSGKEKQGIKILEKELQKEELFLSAKFIEAITKIILEKDGMPKNVYLLRGGILDHPPLEYVSEEYSDEEEEKAAKLVREWLVNGGISGDVIQIKKDFDNYLKQDILGKEKTWLITDRHRIAEKYHKDLFLFGEGKKDIHYLNEVQIPIDEKHRLFLLPFPSFFESARSQGLLKDTEQQIFRRVLNNEFKKIFIG